MRYNTALTGNDQGMDSDESLFLFNFHNLFLRSQSRKNRNSGFWNIEIFRQGFDDFFIRLVLMGRCNDLDEKLVVPYRLDLAFFRIRLYRDRNLHDPPPRRCPFPFLFPWEPPSAVASSLGMPQHRICRKVHPMEQEKKAEPCLPQTTVHPFDLQRRPWSFRPRSRKVHSTIL